MTLMIDQLKAKLQAEGTLTLTLKARPSAQKTKFKGVLDDGTIKIDVAAVPEDGKANEELVRFLRGEFDVKNVEVLTGQTGRLKVVRISE